MLLDHLAMSLAKYANFFGIASGGLLSVDLNIPPTSTGFRSTIAPVSVIEFKFLYARYE
jgi:hypothetical protein